MGLPGSGKTTWPAVPLRERDADGSRALPDDRVRTAGEGAPLRRDARVLRSDGGRFPLFYEALGPSLAEQSPLSSVLDRIVELIRELDTRHDRHRQLQGAASVRTGRRGLPAVPTDLSGRLSADPATSRGLGEYTWDDIGSAPEFAVADAVVALTVERKAEREARVIQSWKLRGSDFRSGKHAYRLSSRGLEVFPRLADPVEEAGVPHQEVERISSGASRSWMTPWGLVFGRALRRWLPARLDQARRLSDSISCRRGEVRPTGLIGVVPGEPNAARADRSGDSDGH